MRTLVFSNVYVAACGAALTAATYPLIGLPARLDAVALLVFISTLVIYNLDRLVEPHPGDSVHERWVQRHRTSLWLLTITAAIGMLGVLFVVPGRVVLSLIPAGLVALGYCVKVLPTAGGWVRLKQVPGAKLLLIAGVWTYATAGLPMIYAGVVPDAQGLAVLLSRLLFIAAVALPFDLPDMQRDRQSGIATLPLRLGVRATRHIAIALALGAAVAGLFNPWPAAAGVLLSVACTLALLARLSPGRSWVYFMVCLDGLLLIQAAAIAVIRMPTGG